MAYFRCGGGEIQQASGGKILLADNPTFTIAKSSSNSCTITWTKPAVNGAKIAKYQIYKYKSTKPTSLNQMDLVGNTTNLTYTVSDLDVPSTYYFVVTTVTDKDYENAYIGEIISIHFTSRVVVMRTDKGIFTSSDLIEWTDVTDRLRPSGSTTIPNIAYCSNGEIFYTDGNVYMSKDGYNWEYKILPTVATPSGDTTYAGNMGVKKHDARPVLAVYAPGGTNFFFLNDYEKGTYNDFSTGLRPDSRIWLTAENPFYFTSSSQTDTAEIIGSSSNVYGEPFDIFSHYVNSSDGYVEYVITNAYYGGAVNVYKRLLYKSSSFGNVFSMGSSSTAGQNVINGFAVKPTNQSDKDILIFAVTSGELYFSFDSGGTWSYNRPEIGVMNLTYDSAEDKFVSYTYISSSKAYFYECDATEEAIKGKKWNKVSEINRGDVKYIIGK